MAITHAVQKGKSIYAYDGGKQLFVKQGVQLMGFTSASVSIKKGNSIYTYDEKGKQISVNQV